MTLLLVLLALCAGLVVVSQLWGTVAGALEQSEHHTYGESLSALGQRREEKPAPSRRHLQPSISLAANVAKR